MGAIHLVRHGQASFGTGDYDRLSELGHEQARLAGEDMAARGLRPDVVIHGGMRRQRETAEGLLAGAGWDCPVEVDPRWAEYNADAVLDAAREAGLASDAGTLDTAGSSDPSGCPAAAPADAAPADADGAAAAALVARACWLATASSAS